jgi:hypothetical protein
MIDIVQVMSCNVRTQSLQVVAFINRNLSVGMRGGKIFGCIIIENISTLGLLLCVYCILLLYVYFIDDFTRCFAPKCFHLPANDGGAWDSQLKLTPLLQ